jgi:hypothetical protein
MQTIHATFDGKVFKPEEKVEYLPNSRFLLIINPISEEEHPLTRIFNLSEEMNIKDLSENHARYSYKY